MFIRPFFRTVCGERRAYWAFVESYRSERGLRQRIVSLGQLDEAGRLGVKQAAEEIRFPRRRRSSRKSNPNGIEVDARRVRVETAESSAGLGWRWNSSKTLGLDELFRETIPAGKADVPGSAMALVIARLVYVLWKTLAGLCRRAGLGDEPRRGAFRAFRQSKPRHP